MARSKLLFSVILGLALPSFAQSTKVDPAYQQSFDKWKTELVADLKENWLPLAGLFWLKAGENAFGSDQKNPVALPAGSCAPQAGVFTLQGKDVTVKFAAGVPAKVDGQSVSEMKLAPDISGKASLVELGSLRMKVIQRGDRVGIRVKDVNSPSVKDYKGPTFYVLQPQYKVTADWVPSDGKKTVSVPNVLGDVTPTPVAGEARFTINGQEFRLEALGGDEKKGLFFVFRDLTSKTDTYPPGRFLDSDPVKDNKVVLDFNEAYNPPCAVTPYATCPLPPKENQLAVAIPAGEKYDRKNGHH